MTLLLMPQNIVGRQQMDGWVYKVCDLNTGTAVSFLFSTSVGFFKPWRQVLTNVNDVVLNHASVGLLL